MNHPRRQVAGLVVWLVGLTAALTALLTVGAERPGAPPLAHPSEWSASAAQREPLDVVAAAARIVAVAALAYLLLVTLAQIATGVVGARAPRQRRWLARITPRFVGALSAAALAAASPAGADEAADGAVASRDPQSQSAAGALMTRPGMGATMQLVTPGEETSLPWADDPAPAPPEELLPPVADPEVTATHRGEWVVRPGDHLWGIAEEVLAERHGSAPSDAEVHRLWVRLIDANRDRLVDPQDPDLILPGQRLALPD